ncbi:AraC family transcriptional regulator [Parasedimentitalea maritima]|uniref:AraC family transcriptional regulator n=2 Tax=Parasedimentitalea maritima TaxID=2578117 RepID=A0ABY2UV13_9RHOB|nr:AraC family transcriptional regulator [Zongyanglinia marina]
MAFLSAGQIYLLTRQKTLDLFLTEPTIRPMDMSNDIPKGLRLNDLGGTEIVCGRFRNHRFPRHSHDGLMLSLVDDGTQGIRYRGETHLGGRGVLIAMPPNEVHAGEPLDDNGWCYRTITIPTAFVQSFSGVRNTHFLCATVIEDDDLIDAMAMLFNLFGDASLLEQEEAIMTVLGRFMAAHTNEPPPQNKTGTEARAVRVCKAFLTSQTGQNVSLANLEEVAGIDRFRLVRSFTRLVGLPPHAWHLQYRLRTAQDMLSRGHPIAEVTYSTGFADQAHLSRTFKRLTGLTPGYYRRTHLALLDI